MKKIYRSLFYSFISSLTFNIFAVLLIPTFIFFISSPFRADHTTPNTSTVTRITPPDYVNVYITKNKAVEQIKFEDYIKGVVAGEMPSSFETEALKAQAVAARTYSLSKILRSGESGFPIAHPSAPICDDVHCQVYISEDSLRAMKGDAFMSDGYKKICRAVDETSGILMYYDGELVSQALFHSSSGGKTENSEDVFASTVPYLRSVSSPYEDGSTHRSDTVTFSLTDMASKLNGLYTDRFTGNFTARDIKIKARTDGGRVEQILIGNASYSGREIREALSLSSANFSFNADSDYITFTTTGYGHGVGMSQYGANGMALRGFTYDEILKHYYTGVTIL